MSFTDSMSEGAASKDDTKETYYIWVLDQSYNCNYDCMHSCVVTAKTENEARQIAAKHACDEQYDKVSDEKMHPTCWEMPEHSTCKAIGVLLPSQVQCSDIVCSDIMNG